VYNYVVPTPRDESDLTQLTPERWRELEQGLGLRTLDPDPADQSIAEALTGPRGGRELWGAALAMVAVLCVAELLLARSASRQMPD
jgi:hypothetical protein